MERMPMGQTKRPMPVREDLWQPNDPILDTIIRRCLDEAESDEGSEGGSTIMGGAIILAVLGVVILAMSGNAQAAIGIPLLLGAGMIGYMILKASGDDGPRHATLAVVGGPGRLPAGYLVHTDAWAAGMAEYVAYLPESQLQASVQMCRDFPGTVDDLIQFTGSIAIHVPATHHATPADVERRAKDLVRVGAPILKDYLAAHPPQPLPSADGKKAKKKK
jgi:hypothetical protein